MSFILMVSCVALLAAVVGLAALRQPRRAGGAHQRPDDLAAEWESARLQLDAHTVDVVSGVRFFRDGTVRIEDAASSTIKLPTVVRDRARLLDLESACGDERTSLAVAARSMRGATDPPLRRGVSREITFGVVTDRWIERLVVTNGEQQERLWAAACATRQSVDPTG